MYKTKRIDYSMVEMNYSGKNWFEMELDRNCLVIVNIEGI